MTRDETRFGRDFNSGDEGTKIRKSFSKSDDYRLDCLCLTRSESSSSLSHNWIPNSTRVTNSGHPRDCGVYRVVVYL